jgi:hypothetical protein
MRPVELALAALFILSMAGAGWFAGGLHFDPHYTKRMERYAHQD